MKRGLKAVLLILGGLLLLLLVAAGGYFYNNMNYDKNTTRILDNAGFTEKQAVLPDGTV